MWRDTQVACARWISDYEILLKLDLFGTQLVVFGLVLDSLMIKLYSSFKKGDCTIFDKLCWCWCGLWYSYNKVCCFTPLHSALFIWNWSWSVMDLMLGILNFWWIWGFWRWWRQSYHTAGFEAPSTRIDFIFSSWSNQVLW